MKKLSPEAEEWAARINVAWAKVSSSRREIKKLAKHRGPGRETKNVELPLARLLTQEGHRIRRQVKCPDGRIDIFDDTTNEIIECKAAGSVDLIVDAAKQLQRYECHFPGTTLVICVPNIQPDSQWIAAAIRAIGIRIVEMDGRSG